MAGKRSAGERVLESKHVIGLFLLMLVFSGIFFSLGYVMGRDGQQVRAANSSAADSVVMAKPEPLKRNIPAAPSAATTSDSDPATVAAPAWDLGDSNKRAGGESHFDSAPSKKLNARSKSDPTPAPITVTSKISKTSANPPLIPSGALLLQVAACSRQEDALNIATSLNKKQFTAFVQTPQKDKLYRVQVGPFRDQKSADVAKKGLEGVGFKAFFVKH